MVTTTRKLVITGLAILTFASGCAGRNASAEDSSAAPTAEVTAPPSPIESMGDVTPSPLKTSPTPNETTPDPTSPAVDKVVVDDLRPEVGQVDSYVHNGAMGTTVCAPGYTEFPLKLGGTVTTKNDTNTNTKIKTTVTKDMVVIKVDGKLLSSESVIVNGTKGAPLDPNVAQARHTTLTLYIKWWSKNGAKTVSFCNGGSGLEAPVPTD